MSDIQLNLVVIRASNLKRAVAFYRLLGLDFIKHRHGNGLEHFACDLGTVVFEIYPRTSEADIAFDGPNNDVRKFLPFVILLDCPGQHEVWT